MTSRASIKQDKNYYSYDSDVIDIDDAEELGWKDGVNKKVGKIHAVDTMCDHAFNDDMSVNFGTCKRQYDVNDEIGLVTQEEDLVNKGTRKRRSGRSIIRSLEETFGINIEELE